jgi:hypothetical protein
MIGALFLIVGGLIVFFGFLLMIPLSGEYELNAMAGVMMLIVGGPIAALGTLLFMIDKL